MKFIKKLFGFGSKKIDWDILEKSVEQKISGIQRPTVRLVNNLSKSTSKFGGRPLVESEKFQWPESNGKPMAFLAQIDLSEIAKQVKYEWLDDKGKWKVLYQKEPKVLADFPDGMDEMSKINESFITAKRVEVLPGYGHPSLEKLEFTEDEGDLYYDMTTSDDDEKEVPLHQVGGFPSSVQGNYMELDSQLASNGVHVGDPKGYESEEAKKLEGGASSWKLLFQFDSDDSLDVMWGDCGMLYFWVEENHSKNNQFENSWLILQCY